MNRRQLRKLPGTYKGFEKGLIDRDEVNTRMKQYSHNTRYSL